MKHLKLLDTAAAKSAGFRPLTIGYQLPQERSMLDNVLADMRRGNINHCLVQSNGSVSVWRGGIANGLPFRTGPIAAVSVPSRPCTKKTNGRRITASKSKKGKRS